MIMFWPGRPGTLSGRLRGLGGICEAFRVYSLRLANMLVRVQSGPAEGISRVLSGAE